LAEEKQEAPVEKKEIKFEVVLSELGSVHVRGPIHNEMLAVWILNKAIDLVKAHNLQLDIAKANAQKPIIETGGIMNFARKHFHR
jgi:hypothetical protein